jgi:tetratricopeptide (TPR) repeat protein
VPSRLPPDLADFTGRAAALASLDALVPDPAAPPGGPIVIAAIEGAGGIGKTTLALHWAHRVRERFADGHLYVNLRGYGPGDPLDPTAALDQLLRDAGLPAEEIPAGLEARSALLRSRLASRRVLLVLDNARDAAQVRPLLPGSTGMVVVTSRDQMRGLVARERAHRIDLDGLSRDEAVTLLKRLLPGRRDPVERLAELARWCGYSPLALTLAADRLRRGTGGTELDDLIGRITAERHRLAAFDTSDDGSGGVRAVFAWSYRALDDETARLFRLLGLQPGPDLGVPAAAALAGVAAGRAGRLLQRLAETNLVEERRPGRYELHDLLRSYATELVDRVDDRDTRGAAIDRLLGYYVHSANAARAAVNPGRGLIEADPPPDGVVPLDFGGDAERALAWFDVERFTLAAAVRYAIGAARHRAAAELTRMVWELLITGHQLGSWEDLQRAAAASARQAGDIGLEGVLSNQLGITLMDQSRYDEAIVAFERALMLFGRAGDERGQAMAHSNLGLVLRMDGRLEESRDALCRALEYYERERLNESGPANNLALTYVAMGRPDEALPLALRAVDIDRATGARIQLAGTLDTLGQVYAGQGRHGDAVAMYHEALSLEQGLSDQKVVGMLVHLGTSYRDSGHPARAAESWQSALRMIDEQGFADGIHLRRSEVVALLAGVEHRDG